MRTWIDLPPLWLALTLAVAWAVGRAIPEPDFGGAWAGWTGTLFIAAGLLLMAAAAATMIAARTTVIPHRDPAALVTGGVFRLSRNPIYLGDALLLAGFILRWDAVLALLLVPVFIWLIDTRFIRAEEARLRSAFGEAYEDWAAVTRRWL